MARPAPAGVLSLLRCSLLTGNSDGYQSNVNREEFTGKQLAAKSTHAR
jgi:hypothetical protein